MVFVDRKLIVCIEDTDMCICSTDLFICEGSNTRCICWSLLWFFYSSSSCSLWTCSKS